MIKPRREAFHKLRILKDAEEIGSVVRICRYFGVGRASFYRWENAYERFGEAGLVDRPSTVLPSCLRLIAKVIGQQILSRHFCDIVVPQTESICSCMAVLGS